MDLPTTFRLARYCFTLTACDTIYLPPFKGSALRGGFGHAFKDMVCFRPKARRCTDCLLRYNCPYATVFATPVPPDAEVLSKNVSIPRPLIIEPPLEEAAEYPPGEELVFQIVLIGRGMDFLSYFLVAFQELGRRGLGSRVEREGRGRRRGRFELTKVEALATWEEETALVYRATQPDHIHAHVLPVDVDAVQARAAQLPTDRLTITFRTPTRLKHRGTMEREGPPFHVVVRRLLDRVSSLSYFHCDEQWEIDFRGWIERAKGMRVVGTGAGWADWARYSSRQDRRIRMGGLVGSVTYEGDLAPFLPLLVLGERVHVGKGTVFGNGWMEVGVE